jgi:hypothetical protein
MVLRNGLFQVTFDDTCGAIRSLVYQAKELPLLENTLDIPFILEKAQNEYTHSFERFSYTPAADTLAFTWELADGITIHAEATLRDGGLCFTSHVENTGAHSVHSLEYPLIDGISRFGEGLHRLVHSYATGLEVDNPLDNFKNDADGFRYMPYPESFSGASMQFFGYFRDRAGGLVCTALDGGGSQKWLNFYKQNGKLRASQIYGYEDVGPGKGLCADWDFRIAYVPGGRWEDCADTYKQWAHEQAWCRKGKLADRDETRRAAWLVEQTGAVTFGIDASHDRTRWIRKYREDIASPLFHILGPDWPKVDQNFHNSLPGGYDDWFPTRFNRTNIECIREQGDRFAPFEFDFLISPEKTDAELIKKNLQVWPGVPKSVDKYTFTMLCPLTAYTQSLHVKRDEQVQAESDCDALYYDISANNIIKTCMSCDHGHPVGAGRDMTGAYRDIYRETKGAMTKRARRYIPIGTEMINDTLIDEVDYYQARANAQPNSALETWPFRSLIRQGKARLVPLFKYVYSQYTPLRCDGWGKLTAETGDIIYHTIAKTYLWGGIFEINLEYSEMEIIDGEGTRGEEHFYHFDPRGFDYDEGPAKFIGDCAQLRLGVYGAPLIYGEMLKTGAPRCRQLYRTYYQYNHGKQSGEQNDRGIILLDAVLAQGYALQDTAALYIINTSLFAEEVEVEVPAELRDRECTLVEHYGDGGAAEVKIEKAAAALTLHLAPLERVVLFTGSVNLKKI